jgi:hypothetical protein
MSRAFLILVVASCITGCTTLPYRKTALTLEYVEKLEVGKITIGDIKQYLGEPSREISKDGLVYLVYSDAVLKHHRASFTFDSKERLKQKYWNVSSSERIQKLDEALKRYPSHNFEVTDAKWDYERFHYAPSARFYADKEKGLTITFNKFKSYVESLSWTEPSTEAKRLTEKTN